MRPKDLVEFVFASLPKDVKADELKALGKEEWWLNNKKMALVYSLRNCKRLDWDAYLQNNEDLKKFGVDPVLHFLENGIYEGRKLISRNKLQVAASNQAIKISIIIPNFNNAAFLRHCLDSALAQTLKEIEIIIVDDKSTDESAEIINKYASIDSRIRFLSLKENVGTHLARKFGVEAARGRFMMFLDSDDSLTPDACMKVLEVLGKGHDMAEFNVRIAGVARNTGKVLQNAAGYFNRLAPGMYDGKKLLPMLAKQNAICANLINKAFVSEIVKDAFRQMEDGRYILGEDFYELFVIGRNIRRFIKIPETLYIYSHGRGISSERGNREGRIRAFFNSDSLLPVFERFCKKYNLQDYVKFIKSYYLPDIFAVFPLICQERISDFFNKLVKNFGLFFIVKAIMHNYFNKWEEVSSQFVYYDDSISTKHTIRKIGIFYLRLSPGGIESTIQNLCRLLSKDGYEVTLFLQEKSEYDISVDDSVKIVYLNHSRTLADSDRHLGDLYSTLAKNPIDVMIYLSVHDPMVLWDIMLMRLMGISVIGSLRLDMNIEMLVRGRSYSQDAFLKTMRCFNKVFCLSKSAELYLRIHNIDAICIPNTIRHCQRELPPEKRDNKIVVIARLDERLKKALSCLAVLKEVLKEVPDCEMIFVGDFNSDVARKAFEKRARDLHVADNVFVTGWTEDTFHWIDQCKLMFSASFLEGFPNGIAEAQSRGLPVVMYDLDIMMAEDNAAIIRVPQDDVGAAAKNICRLLQDEPLRRRLAAIAVAKAGEYSDARFAENILRMLETFQNESELKRYKFEDYRKIIRYMAFYAGKGVPAY